MIGLTLQMVLKKAVGFRACSGALQVLLEFVPQFRAAPAYNTIVSWLLRVGLHELQRPKERADDWVLFMDHTMQLGAWKCLVIVGIRQSVWQQLDAPLTHENLTMLTLKPVMKSDGAQVNQELEAIREQIGTPRALLNDGGSDLINGAAKFQENHPTTLTLGDIAHKTAVLLKRELQADPRWEEFLKHCGRTQPQVKQTELGYLAPPTLKVKARYMNLGSLIRWGRKMLHRLDTPAAERPATLNLSRLDEKFGWIRDFRPALDDWNDLEDVIECGLKYARSEGYHPEAAQDLRLKFDSVARTETGRRMANAMANFVEEQSQGLKAGESVPASSEVLESLIGKGKRLQGQHSRGGFTKSILGMAASVVNGSRERVCEALETVRNLDVINWCHDKLGPSLTAQRRRVLPATIGTKLG
jgi:hypothetical protein